MKAKINSRIFLSPPHITSLELEFVKQAFESNYIAPLGPMVDAFEREFAQKVGIGHAVAVVSGTAGMHLALRVLGVGPGDEVVASTLTFIGSVTPIVFQGARPVFIDADRTSWNMDPDLLAEELHVCKRRGRMPKAVIPTDLYGQCADLDRILEICAPYGIPVVSDSAEALGAQYKWSVISGKWSDSEKNLLQRRPKGIGSTFYGVNKGAKTTDDDKSTIDNRQSTIHRHAGKGAKAAVFSFNGNKIITTSGGGMLASEDEDLIEQARSLARQACDPAPHYEHSRLGYNYRMSNILAAIGRGQLRVLDKRVETKRKIFEYYKQALGDVPGIEFMPEAPYGRSNRWLTVILITPDEFGADREAVRLALEAENIETRPIWKPMHLQPVFKIEGLKAPRLNKLRISRGRKGSRLKAGRNERRYKARVVGGAVSEDLFKRGLCVPSGTAMTDEDMERVISVILGCGR